MKNTISNQLIIISLIFTILVIILPELRVFWMNNFFLNSGEYYYYFLQFFTYQFIHWGFFHFLFNSVFLYYFWNLVEIIIWRKKYIYFFLFNTFFVWLGIIYFSSWNTVWISGFCLALLTYYTLELKSKKHPDWTGWVTAIILNLLMWLSPWISLVGHLFWIIAWIIFYFINKEFLRKLMMPIASKRITPNP